LKYRNILLCTDYSKDAESAFVHALDQAVKYQVPLHVMTVIPSLNPCDLHLDTSLSKEGSAKESYDQDERHRLQEIGALRKMYADRCKDVVEHVFVVKVDSPDVAIIRYADEHAIDLIILGTAGRHEKKRLTYIKTAANVSKFANSQIITIGSPNDNQCLG